jgi:hypothetical protein
MQRHKITSDRGDVLWSLYIIKRIIDGCTIVAKIVGWWVFKTQVNPNKANVTTQHLEARVWDEKPTHYLMET